MKFLFALVALVISVQAQQDQLIYPDQFEQMKQDDYYKNGLPQAQSDSNINRVGTVNNNGGHNGFQRPSVYDQFLPPKWRDHVLNVISKGVTKFTLDMDRVIEKSMATRPDTLLFSPVSLTMTLAMVLLASGGKTFEEVSKILGLESGIDISHHSEIVHQIFGLIIKEYEQRIIDNPTTPRCDIAFGIFVEDGFPIRQQFKNISEKIYKNEVINVDFSDHGREAKDLINKWVSEKTMNKIKNMLEKEPDRSTQVMILSALYFNGEWNSYFYSGATRRRDFTVEKDETVYVDMMYNGGEFMYAEDPRLGVKIIELPYKGNEVSMYVLMPNTSSATDLKNMKSQLSPEYIDQLLGSMENASCILGFPKMQLSNTLNLRDALQSLGLQSLFDPATADLSVLSPGNNNFNSQQQQQQQQKQQQQHQHQQPQSILANSERSFSGTMPQQQQIKTFNQQSGYHKYWDANYGVWVEQWGKGFNIHHPYNQRNKRETASRSIDQEFVRYLNTNKLPNFGVDELRNSAGIKNPGLFAEEVVHKVEMTINEKGTEAAAATSVGLNRSGDYKKFIANKPFLFFIRHNPTKLNWFWGTINRPTPHYTTPE